MDNKKNQEIKDYIGIIYRHNWLIIIVFIFVVGGWIIRPLYQEPLFRATCKLMVGGGMALPYSGLYKESGRDYLRTQIEILKSEVLQNRVKEKLVGWTKKLPPKELCIKPKVSWRGSLIVIEATHYSKEYVKEYLRTLAHEFIQFKREHQTKASTSAVSGLTQELKRLADKIKKTEDAIYEFRKKHKSIPVDSESNPAANGLYEIHRKINALELERMFLKEKLAQFQKSDKSIPLKISEETFSDTEAVILLENKFGGRWEQLGAKWKTTKDEIEELSKVLKPKHPKLKELKNELSEVTEETRNEKLLMINKMKARYSSLELEKNTLNKIASHWQNLSLGTEREQNKLDSLIREQNRTRGLYDLLLKRLGEIDITTELNTPQIQIMGPVTITKIGFEQITVRELLMAIIFALGLGIAISFALEYMDDTIKKPEDIEEYLKLKHLITIPLIKKEDFPLITTSSNFPAFKETYHNLATELILLNKNDKSKSLLITSSLAQEGKTSVAVNLAITLAQAGEKILLIDADIHKGQLHQIFGLDNKKGLNSFLEGKYSPNEMIVSSNLERLDIVTRGDVIQNPTILLQNGKIKELLNWAHNHYDHIILDSTPILAISDGLFLASFVQGIIFVVYGAKVSRERAKEAIKMLSSESAKLIGCVINKLPFKYYRYRYYYKKRYHSHLRNKS